MSQAINVIVDEYINYICSVLTNKNVKSMPDFGYGGIGKETTNSGSAEEQRTDLESGGIDITGGGGESATDVTITPVPEDNDTEGNGNEGNGENADNGTGGNDNDSPTLVEGTQIEVDDNTYTVDKGGNLLDKDGNIFKEAKDVQEFIKSFDSIEGAETELSIDAIKDRLGVDVVGEDGKPIEFDNTPEGVAAYVESVIEQRQEEFAAAGVNQLLENYPIVQDVINYYVANGNSLDGFGEVKDRSNIVIDEKNIAQQEAIIRESFKEFDKRGNVDEYIQYVKDKGMLYDIAKEELQGLIDSDLKAKEEIAQAAKEAAIKEQQDSNKYWSEVQEVVKNRKIAGYEIPETIIINKDGKKIAATPNDFFNYVYQVDEQGISRYHADLAKLTPEQKRDDSLLRAYLRFTGGSYADLVNLAIKDKEVTKLRLKAKENNKRTARIVPPATNKPNGGKMNFGY